MKDNAAKSAPYPQYRHCRAHWVYGVLKVVLKLVLSLNRLLFGKDTTNLMGHESQRQVLQGEE